MTTIPATKTQLSDGFRSEEEAAQYWEANPGKPYIIEISRNDQSLYYYGTYGHFYEVDHPMLLDIEQQFQVWLTATRQPRIVLTEGGTRTPPQTREGSMRQGEAVFTSWLAEMNGVEHLSPEVPESRQRELLLAQGFTKDQIQYYFFALNVNQYWDMGTTDPFDDYIKDCLESDMKGSGWSEYDFSLEHMYQLHQDLWGKPFSIEPEFGIIEEESPVRDVVEAAGVIRDEGIASAIINYWHQGCSVFAVFGGSHPVIQEPVLRSSLVGS